MILTHKRPLKRSSETWKFAIYKDQRNGLKVGQAYPVLIKNELIQIMPMLVFMRNKVRYGKIETFFPIPKAIMNLLNKEHEYTLEVRL